MIFNYNKYCKSVLENDETEDKYAEKRFGIPNEEDEYEMKYQQSRNQDPITTTTVRNKSVSIYKRLIIRCELSSIYLGAVSLISPTTILTLGI